MTALKDKLTRRKGLLAISLGLVVLLVAAACGGGGDNNGVEPTTVPSGSAGDTLEDETTKKNGDSLVDDATNHPPTADFVFDPQAVPIGDNFETVVTFNATGSDPDGDQLSYEWAFQGGRPTAATGGVATTTFPGAAPYEVTLTVSDGRGSEFTVTKVVPNVQIPNGDSVGVEDSPTLEGPSVHPDDEVSEKLEDETTKKNGDSLVDDATNHPPTADFVFDPQAVPIGDNFETVVTFNATGSDPDGDQLSYEWAFQGGRPTAATGGVATTTFPGAAPYEVTLTVSDGRGSEFTVTKVVPNVQIPNGDSVGVEDSPTLEGPSVHPDDEVSEKSESMDQTELSLTDQDKAAIIRLSLERALVAKEIPDYGLWHAGKDSVVLSTENLDVALVPKLPNIDLIILGPDDIQIKADAEGDFMYLRFSELKVGDAEVQVDLGNWWAVGKDSKVQHLSGGFFTLEYEKVSGEWVGTVLAVALS